MPKCLKTTVHHISLIKLFEVREPVTAANRISVSSIQQVPPQYDRVNRVDAPLDVKILENFEWDIRFLTRTFRNLE